MKEELKEKFVTRTKHILKTGLNSKNLVTALNIYVVSVLTYSFGIIGWNDTELEDLERRVRVLMAKNRMLHPKSAIERVNTTWKQRRPNLKRLHDKQVANIKKYFHRKKQTSELHQGVVEANRDVTIVRLQEESARTIKGSAKENDIR